jgi:thymidylate synthase (FAD)
MGKVGLKVSLVTSTPEPEKAIALAAKLCYASGDAEALSTAVNAKEQGQFIEKLVQMGHLSPIEHVSFTFLVEGVSRSLLAQITRHRIASFSVRSQRYVNHSSVEGACFDYIVPPQIQALGTLYEEKYAAQMAQVQEWYDDWVKDLGGKGESSNEDARFILPNAAETKFMLTMNARELQHFFRLRCCRRSQWEIRALAVEMLRIVKQLAPELFECSGPGCLEGPCPEGEMTCGQMLEVRAIFGNLK